MLRKIKNSAVHACNERHGTGRGGSIDLDHRDIIAWKGITLQHGGSLLIMRIKPGDRLASRFVLVVTIGCPPNESLFSQEERIIYDSCTPRQLYQMCLSSDSMDRRFADPFFRYSMPPRASSLEPQLVKSTTTYCIMT